MANAEYRVLVDWNKDGWFNTGVSSDTPMNLVPDAIWGVTNVMNFRYKDEVTNPRKQLAKTKYTSPYGFSEIKNVNGTDQDYYLGFSGMQDYQLNDLANKSTPLISGVASMNYARNLLQRQIYPVASDYFKSPLALVSYVPASGSVGNDSVSKTPIVSVTAGNAYTFRILAHPVYALPHSNDVSMTITIKNQAGTTIATSASLPTSSPIDVQFTAGVGMTGMYFDFVSSSASGTTYTLLIDNFQLYAGSPTSGQMYNAPVDPAITFIDEQFDAVIPAGVAHYASVYTRETAFGGSGAHSHSVSVFVCPIGSNTYTELTPTSTTPTFGEWTRLTFAIPAQASRSGVFMHVSVSATTHHEFAGLCIAPGSALSLYNTGEETAQYEDVTSYVKNVTWKIGKTNLESGLPDDGEAQFKMNNETRLFSPDNADSPLYHMLDRGQRIMIQTRWSNLDEWDTRWTGWSDTYEVDPGEFGQREALIRAKQGLDRIRDGKLWFLIEEDVDFIDTVKSLINESGWVTASDAPGSLVGFETLLDVNAYVADPDEGYDTLEDGVANVDFVGFGWDENTSVKDALTSLLQSQNAQLFINRDGSISIYNRNHFINAWLNYEHDIDLNEFPAVTYQYGEDIVNSISVTIQKKRALPSGTIWQTKRAVKVAQHSTRELTVNYQFDEGQGKTALTVDPTPTVTVYNVDPGLTGTIAPITTPPELSVELSTDGSNRTFLKMINTSAYNMWVDIEIDGVAVDRGDNEVIVVEDSDAIAELNELQKTTINNTMISDFDAAFAAAWTVLGRRSTPGGEFDSFAFYIEDEDAYDNMNDIKVADRIIVSEFQTGEEDLQHIIVEENGTISSGGLMKIEYSVKRSDQTHYQYAEGTLESKYDNLIWEFPILPIFDGSVTKINDVYNLLDNGIYGVDFYVGVKNLQDLSIGKIPWYTAPGGSVDITGSSTAFGLIYGDAFLGINRGVTTQSILRTGGSDKQLSYWAYSKNPAQARIRMYVNGGAASTISTYLNTNPSLSFIRDLQLHPTGATPQVYHLEAEQTPGKIVVFDRGGSDIYLDSSKTYTVAMYGRAAAGFAAETYVLDVLGVNSAVYATASSSFNSGGIDTLSVTFTGLSYVAFRISKNNTLTHHKFNLYGFKLVEGSVAPSSYLNIPNPDFLDIFV